MEEANQLIKKKQRQYDRRQKSKAKRHEAKLLANMARDEEKERMKVEIACLKSQIATLKAQIKPAKVSFRSQICFRSSSVKPNMSKSQKSSGRKKSVAAMICGIKSTPTSLDKNSFRVIRETGLGGTFGSIDIMAWAEQEKTVVRKTINPQYSSTATVLCEAKVMMLVSGHTHFPLFYGMIDSHELIMEDLGRVEDDGSYAVQTVHRAIGKGQFSQKQCVLIAQQVCEGLVHLHDINILHNDLKSNNVILRPDDHWPNFQVKIIDFGKSTLKSSPNIYNLPSEDILVYNVQHRYIAHEIRNVPNTKQSEMTDTYSVGYLITQIGQSEQSKFLTQIGEKMKTVSPEDRLPLTSALALLKKFR